MTTWFVNIDKELSLSIFTNNIVIKSITVIFVIIIIFVTLLLIWYKFFYSINVVIDQIIIKLIFLFPLIVYILEIIYSMPRLKMVLQTIVNKLYK